MPALGELGLHQLLDGREPQLGEPRDLVAGERLVRDVGESGTAPEPDRLAQCPRRPGRIARAKRLSPLAEQTLEPLRVHLVVPGFEDVSRRARDHPAPGFAERPAKLRDPDAEGRLPAAGRRRAPELLEEDLLGDHLVRADEECGQQGALLLAAQGNRVPLSDDFEWPQDAEIHAWHGTLHPFARRYGLVTGDRDAGHLSTNQGGTMENAYVTGRDAAARRRGARLRGGDDRGPAALPRVARRRLGHALLPSRRLHAGVHDRAR